MKSVFAILPLACFGSIASAQDEMPLWSYFDSYWAAIDTVCGHAISDPQWVVDGLASDAFGEGVVGVDGMPLGVATPRGDISGAFLRANEFNFNVTVASLSSVVDVTCEAGEPDHLTVRTLGTVHPQEISRQLEAWLKTQPNFEYAGGQLMIKMTAASEPLRENEYDFVISSPVGGQNIVYTLGIYGAGLDLMMVHQVRD